MIACVSVGVAIGASIWLYKRWTKKSKKVEKESDEPVSVEAHILHEKKKDMVNLSIF